MKIFLFFVFFHLWNNTGTSLNMSQNSVLTVTSYHVQATGYILNSFLHQAIQLHCLQIYKYLFRFALFKYRFIHSFTFGKATQEIMFMVKKSEI